MKIPNYPSFAWILIASNIKNKIFFIVFVGLDKPF